MEVIKIPGYSEHQELTRSPEAPTREAVQELLRSQGYSR